MLLAMNCGKSLKEVSMVEPELDGTSCDHIKPGTEFSNAVDNETDLGGKLSDANHLENDDFFRVSVQAQSHPVDESYGGNPNFLFDVLQVMSNAPDLALEKESSDNFVNGVLQTECGNDYSIETLSHGKIDSPKPITLSAEDQLLGSTLSGSLHNCSPTSSTADGQKNAKSRRGPDWNPNLKFRSTGNLLGCPCRL